MRAYGGALICDSTTPSVAIFYGDQAEQSLQNYHFDMLFLGVDAIDLGAASARIMKMKPV